MNFSLAAEIEFGVKIIIVISALILFLSHLKPFKKINTYFSIYAIAGMFLVIGLIFRGILGALIFSIILFPIIPNDKELEKNGFTISTPFQGFMKQCCTYQIKERQLLIFEKDYGLFELEGEGPINFETLNIELSETEILFTYSTDFDKGIIKKKIVKR